MKSIRLKQRPDLGNRLFLSIPVSTGCGSGMWVSGDDYAYNKDNNTIVFKRNPIRPYGLGGQPNESCTISSGTTLWVFYRAEGEIANLKRKYGQNLPVETLDYLNSMAKNSANVKCFQDADKLTVRLSGMHWSSGRHIYDKESVEAVKKIICKNKIEVTPPNDEAPKTEPPKRVT